MSDKDHSAREIRRAFEVLDARDRGPAFACSDFTPIEDPTSNLVPHDELMMQKPEPCPCGEGSNPLHVFVEHKR